MKKNLDITKVWNGVIPEDLLRYDEKTKTFWVGRTQLDANAAHSLKQEAVHFRETLIWRLLVNMGTEVAVQRLAFTSKDWDDVYFGKAMLFELDVMDKWLQKLAQLEIA